MTFVEKLLLERNIYMFWRIIDILSARSKDNTNPNRL